MAKKSMDKPAHKLPTGPKPERVTIGEDWETAVGKALKKEKPAQGWPSPDKNKKD